MFTEKQDFKNKKYFENYKISKTEVPKDCNFPIIKLTNAT
jgi:hypothetical protein